MSLRVIKNIIYSYKKRRTSIKIATRKKLRNFISKELENLKNITSYTYLIVSYDRRNLKLRLTRSLIFIFVNLQSNGRLLLYFLRAGVFQAKQFSKQECGFLEQNAVCHSVITSGHKYTNC